MYKNLIIEHNIHYEKKLITVNKEPSRHEMYQLHLVWQSVQNWHGKESS